MANRDKSQNVGFVYTNIYQLYKNSQSAAANITSDSRVWRAEDLGELKITKFQPRTLARPVAATPEVAASRPAAVNPFDDLKQNIAKLQDLHSKLRFMLHELEDLVGKK